MQYVYILQSLADPERHYTGCTADLKGRLKSHNAGNVPHTSKFGPWKVMTYIAFSDDAQAFAFENISNRLPAAPLRKSGCSCRPTVVPRFTQRQRAEKPWKTAACA